ncbi:MAG: pentapeptide repeat-containing protein [Lachnospiraceae bacterium]|nr:pentapeptide repeat-containing protein [Lachnospiraceae bacterium]
MKYKINKPILEEEYLQPINLLRWRKTSEEEDILKEFLVQNEELSEEDFYKTDAANGKFVRCRFLHCNFEKASFVDVIFDHCDLSNSSFSEAYFSRCEFRSCKCMGTDLHETILKHVLITECQFSYANMSGVFLEKAQMQQSDFTEAAFVESRYKSWTAIGCKFIRTNFFHTMLRGFDFSENEMSDILVSDSMEEVQGCKISAVQALEAARLLKMKVM